MTIDERLLKERVYGIDATLRVGQFGIESVSKKSGRQLRGHRMSKINFHRTMTDELAESRAKRADAALMETRGNTTICH